uniref:Uncharacterized protein n=1 Tax=Trebouxia lynnae TaxID=1825957 RepID=A0A6B9VQZ7_9CHLO|nr:hypothetical protein [Trebouxia lynnae]QHO63925.1 hypothetical protein [Trebouxia lynnae]
MTFFFFGGKTTLVNNVPTEKIANSGIIVLADVGAEKNRTRDSGEDPVLSAGSSQPEEGEISSGGGAHGGDGGGDPNRRNNEPARGHYDDMVNFMFRDIRDSRKARLSEEELAVLRRNQERHRVRIIIYTDVALTKSGSSHSNAAEFSFSGGESQLYTQPLSHGRPTADYSLHTNSSTFDATIKAAQGTIGEGSSRGGLASSGYSGSSSSAQMSPQAALVQHGASPAESVNSTTGDTTMASSQHTEAKQENHQEGGGGRVNAAGLALSLLLSGAAFVVGSRLQPLLRGDSNAYRSGQALGRDLFDLDLERGERAQEERKLKYRIPGVNPPPLKARPRAILPDLKKEAHPAFQKGRDAGYTAVALQHQRTHNSLPDTVNMPHLDASSSIGEPNHRLGSFIGALVLALLQSLTPFRGLRRKTNKLSKKREDK